MSDSRRDVSGDRPRRGFRGTAENSKTKICMRWEAGSCRFGDRCNFAHGDTELRTLPPRSPRGRGRGRGGYDGGRGRGGRDGGRQVNGGRPMDEDPTYIASGRPVAGPNGWTQYMTEDHEKYYHNSETNETTWDVPDCWPDHLL